MHEEQVVSCLPLLTLIGVEGALNRTLKKICTMRYRGGPFGVSWGRGQKKFRESAHYTKLVMIRAREHQTDTLH